MNSRGSRNGRGCGEIGVAVLGMRVSVIVRFGIDCDCNDFGNHDDNILLGPVVGVHLMRHVASVAVVRVADINDLSDNHNDGILSHG